MTIAATMAGTGCGVGDADPARTADTVRTPQAPIPARSGSARVVVRKRVITFVDRRRAVRRRDGRRAPRQLVTVVRFPERHGGGRRAMPLVVFAHGYALAPERYRALLYAWARAGYVVAAPAFPGERPDAPGGPDRSDLLNEPADLRFVVDRLLRWSRRTSGDSRGIVNAARVALAGHSDGGDAALAVAYDARFRSRRVDATIVLAGADLPGLRPFGFRAGGPPMLAVQGGADRVNPPADTMAFYRRARPPKLLVTLPGAGHLGPYVARGRARAVVERSSIAYLDRVLKGKGSWNAVIEAGRRTGVSRVTANLAG